MVQGDPQQPKRSDAVLGGQSTMPLGGVVLGGLEGVKRRLAGKIEEQRIDALREALNYGQRGLDLVIRALRDESKQIRRAAYELLKPKNEPRVILALEIFSESWLDYTHLQNLLRAGKWREAERETTTIFLGICGLNRCQQINASHLIDFPCEDLGIIDRLWMRHSKGRFGFSVQQPIWQQCDRSRWDKGEAWSLFGDRVGWRVNNSLIGVLTGTRQYRWKHYDELTFSLSAPKGHLPWVNGIFTTEAIANRLIACSQDGEELIDLEDLDGS